MLVRFISLAIVFLAAAAPAGAEDVCSRDSFTIDGSPVAAVLCASAQAKPASGPVSVTAAFTSKGTSFSKTITLEVVPGEEQSRAIEEVSLSPLGSARSLYMTITYKGGKVALAHAVLLPGAVTLK
jgi:hypothetical protein